VDRSSAVVDADFLTLSTPLVMATIPASVSFSAVAETLRVQRLKTKANTVKKTNIFFKISPHFLK
jgi:hypothetical protein